MKIRKSFAAIGAALMMVGISAPVFADHLVYDWCEGTEPPNPTTITASLEALATELRCNLGSDANPGTWPVDYPIWQKRGSGSCEVQDSLAKKLDEKREEGTKPPRNKNNSNGAAGAANDVRNGKYLAAVDKLDAFIKDVYKSRLNDWENQNGFANPGYAKSYFVKDLIQPVVQITQLIGKRRSVKRALSQHVPGLIEPWSDVQGQVIAPQRFIRI